MYRCLFIEKYSINFFQWIGRLHVHAQYVWKVAHMVWRSAYMEWKSAHMVWRIAYSVWTIETYLFVASMGLIWMDGYSAAGFSTLLVTCLFISTKYIPLAWFASKLSFTLGIHVQYLLLLQIAIHFHLISMVPQLCWICVDSKWNW